MGGGTPARDGVTPLASSGQGDGVPQPGIVGIDGPFSVLHSVIVKVESHLREDVKRSHPISGHMDLDKM